MSEKDNIKFLKKALEFTINAFEEFVNSIEDDTSMSSLTYTIPVSKIKHAKEFLEKVSINI